MPERTAGQRAYETYAALLQVQWPMALQAQWPMALWQALSPLERYAWEAAAQAVLAMEKGEETCGSTVPRTP